MDIFTSDEKYFSEVESIGIALKAYQLPQNHAAILFLDQNSEPKFLHLSEHNSLRYHPPKDDYIWMQLGDEFEIYDKEYLKAFVIDVARINPESTGQYGLDINSKCIDKITGKFVSEYRNKIGLTCATFVMEVFDARGYTLVDTNAWLANLPENIAWQQQLVIPHLVNVGAEPAYIVKQEDNIGNPRILPEEVAAATQLPIPASKNDVENLSQEIIKKLRA